MRRPQTAGPPARQPVPWPQGRLAAADQLGHPAPRPRSPSVTRPLLGAMRSHACGTLRAADAGIEVHLAGWVVRRCDPGGVIFLDLRDSFGVVQLVVHFVEAVAAAAAVYEVCAEDCIRVIGTVGIRPANN